MGETSFQFQCPSCSAVLQATLQKELTSVQCGECYDVFDVQHPGSVAAGADAANGEAAPSAGAEAPEGADSAETTGDDGPRKQQRGNAGVDVHSAGLPPQAGMVDDEATAQNLESSLQSCTAHRERIEQMLADEPNNKNLLDLREQLTNAITQLQGTKEMVARTQASRRPGMPGIGAAFAMGAPEKGPSCRKNKAQRCSVCGGIGHKSRTCSVVQQQQALQQQQQVQMQHVAGVHMHQASANHGVPVQVPMYAAVPAMPPQVQVTAAAPPPMAAALSMVAPPPMAAAPPPMATAPLPAVDGSPPPPPLSESGAATALSEEAKPELLVEPQGAA